MRPGQNKRMRGRNNRKGPNPLTRTYESNGPDVKIRGTAQHITEKYLQLARDAQASGDIVVAENYLQHAEHYYRIIATAQAAQAQSQLGFGRPGEEIDEGEDDDDFVALPDRFASPFERSQPNGLPGQNGAGPAQNPIGMGQQPYLDRPAFSGEFMDRPQNAERQDRGDRPERAERQDRGERPERGDNRPERGERQDRSERPERQDRQERPHRNDRRFNAQGERNERPPGRGRFRDQPRFEPAPEGREQPDVDFSAMSALPAFITAPMRPLAPPPAAEPRPVAEAEARSEAKSDEQPRVKPVEAKPAAAKSAEVKSDEVKSDEVEPVEAKAVEAKPLESKPLESKPVEPKSVDAPAPAAEAAPPAGDAAPQEEDEGKFHLRPRRRRPTTTRAEQPAEGGSTETPEPSSAE